MNKIKRITFMLVLLLWVLSISGCAAKAWEKETALSDTTKIEATQESNKKPGEATELAEAPSPNDSEITNTEEKFIRQRIENYTKEYFRFTEDVQVDTEDGKTSVTVIFVPEVGSIVIKEEIYESMAAHAYQITNFFPEVNDFYYIVLSQQYEKDEAMYLTIDEIAVEKIEGNYTNQLRRIYYNEETQFAEVFSEIEETEESKTWRETVDVNAELP